MHVFFSYLVVVLFRVNSFSDPLHSLTIKITKYKIRCKARSRKKKNILICVALGNFEVVNAARGVI